MRTDLLRLRIDAAIAAGLVVAGCGPVVGGGSSSGDGTADGTTGTRGTTDAMSASVDSATLPTQTAEAEAEAEAEVEAEAEADAEVESDSDDLPSFDLGLPADLGEMPPTLDCEAPPAGPLANCGEAEHEAGVVYTACIQAPPDLPDCPTPGNDAFDEALGDQLTMCGTCESFGSPICGPEGNGNGECCYWGLCGDISVPGRPLLVDGEARVAAIVESVDWCDVTRRGDAAGLDDDLAAAWLQDACFEHASIAAFGRFALQLLAIAAPPRFVAAAHRAALDELEHARVLFSLAARHGAGSRGPGPLSMEGAIDCDLGLVDLVVATVREGCIGETISAMQLARAAAGARDPWLRAQLERIVEQELEHVDLAWSFVAWAHARGDTALRSAIASAFAEAPMWIPKGAPVEPAPGDRERWRDEGRLDARERIAVAHETIEHVVWPQATRMLGGVGSGEHHAVALLAT